MAEILTPQPGEILGRAGLEHLSAELFDHVQLRTPFDLLVPMKNIRPLRKQLRAIPAEQFTRRWAGFATAKLPYKMARSGAKPVFQFAQRTGEKPGDYRFGAFLSTTDRDEVEALTLDYPKRWHVEEFFNAHQARGWKRAGTLNLNIRYGQMTMALIAQAVLHRTRRLLGEPYSTWDAGHFAKSLLAGLEGDIRVHDDTIVVTYYNAPALIVSLPTGGTASEMGGTSLSAAKGVAHRPPRPSPRLRDVPPEIACSYHLARLRSRPNAPNVPLLREHYEELPDHLEREQLIRISPGCTDSSWTSASGNRRRPKVKSTTP